MPFVLSAGQLRVLDQPVVPAAMAVALSDTLSVEYAEIWRTQPQVRTVVDFLARNIASLGVHVFQRVSDLDRVRLTDHPVAVLLAQPNPFTTTYRWLASVVSDLAIYDNALSAKVRVGSRQPRALVRLDPRRVTPVGDDPFAPDRYEVRGSKGRRELPAEQVVHFRGYNPVDPRWGASPIESLRQILLEEYAAGRYREQLWRNGARVSGYLKRPVEAPSWSSVAKTRFREQWQAQYAGEGPQAGGTPILEDGMEFVAAAVTPEAAQYVEARKLTREEVAAAYHIPPPMVGILDRATYSNITQQHKHLYQDTLGPWLEMLQQDLELQLLPDFPSSERVYVEFNLAAKLRGSFEEQATQLQSSVGAPYMTRNEARARLNLPQLPGGDDLVTPLNVVIGGQASPTDSAPPPKQAPLLRRVKTAGGGRVKVKTCPVSIKAAGTQDGTEDGVFEAIVATWDLDSVGDKILPGAFQETLAEWKASGDPIPVLWSHMSHDPEYHIGEVLDAEERDEGLWVKARIDLDDDSPKAKRIYRLLKGRRVKQFSFAYEVLDGALVDRSEDGDGPYYELRKLRLFEVGPTLVGANQATELLTVKADKDGDPVRDAVSQVSDALAAVKSGRVLSAKNEDRVREIARLAKELLDSLPEPGSSDDEKATSAPPADPDPTPDTEVSPVGKATEPAGLNPASLRQRIDLEALEAEVLTLTD